MQEIPFGPYRLVQELGAGGMAVVWRAVIDGPAGFAREVVIKRVLPELARSEEFVRMLLGEARLSARLRHPGIVQVHELGQVDGEYFLAMEYVEGRDLVTIAERCRERDRPLPIGLACFIAREVAAALAYAHTLADDDGRPLGIVHRDVSPSNVMISSAGAVKLLDFGIAKAADHFRRERTQTGVLKGKLSYLSPEQAEGEELDGRSDLFALGIVLHECLTNRRLFCGETELKTLRLVRESTPAPPSATRQEVPPELDAVVMKMLARRREDRYANGDEIVAALAPLAHRFEGSAARLRSFARELTGQVARAPRAAISTMAGVPPSRELTTGSSSNGELDARDDEPLEPAVGHHSPWIMAALGAVAATGIAVIATSFRAPYAPGVPGAATTVPAVSASAMPAPAASPPATAPPAATATSAPALAPPAAATVRLQVAGSAGASVTLDGRPLGRVPLDIQLLRDGASHRLRVAHTNGEAVDRTIVADRDLALEIVLSRRPSSHRATPHAPTTPVPAPNKPRSGEIEDPFAN